MDNPSTNSPIKKKSKKQGGTSFRRDERLVSEGARHPDNLRNKEKPKKWKWTSNDTPKSERSPAEKSQTAHSKMRRRIENPRILLLDTPLEYKKGESQTNVEITNEEDWNTLLKMEEEYVENMCMEIIAFKPDIVITEKVVSDLAQHYFAKANITAFRRLRKTDNNRVARATGATIVSRTDEIREEDIGTGCGLFEM